MRRIPSRAALLALFVAGLGSAAWSVRAQASDAPPVVYRREVFQYPRAGRPDPFRSLVTPEELGYRVQDVQLTGVIYSPNSRLSVAVLSETATKKRFRLHVGERIGGITIAAIYPRRVDVVVNEFGVIRRETLLLHRPEPIQSGEPQPAPMQPQVQQPQQGSPPPSGAVPTRPAVPNRSQR
ncbi:MAG TPA: hypothetical protein VF263_11850 [Longimicrobiaceae bacterium]